MKLSCQVCLKEFNTHDKKAKYCGRECYYTMKRLRKDKVNWTTEMRLKMSKKYKGNGNPMFGKESWCKGKSRPEITGNKHAHWKGGFWITSSGHKVIQNKQQTNGEKVFEHRKIWIEQFGSIPEGMVIHHKNHNKLDNRIENLEMVTRAEHIEIHRKDLLEVKKINNK